MMMVNKNEDRERRYIINPESGLEIGMFRCSPEKNIYSPTEIYMQNKQMYVFQSQPLVTEECMINPVCKSVPLDNLSNEAQQQAIYDDYIRRQGEQRLSEARQMALQYRQPAFMPNRNDAVNPVPNLAGNNNIQFPSDSRYAFMEGQLILRDNDTPEVLANFDIKPMIEVIQLLGEEQVSSKIKAVIIFEDHKSVFYIPSEDVKNVLTYARKADICCNVEYNPAKVAEKITHLFISRLNKIPKEFVQTQAGWVFKNGKVIFSHDASSLCHLNNRI